METLHYTDDMALRPMVTAGIALFGLAISTGAYAQSRLITLETEDAFVYMDEEGVSLKADKIWSCKRMDQGEANNPQEFNKAGYDEFRRHQIEDGEWDKWLCSVKVGAVSFSREVREAQRRMNMAPDRPDCAPWVPETGRLNWEALDYARCFVKKEVEAARLNFNARKAAALSGLVGDPASDFNTLVAKSKLTKLQRTVEGCGKTLVFVYDYVSCRMEGEDAILTNAETYYQVYSDRIDARRGHEPLSQMDASGIGEDSKLIRRTLRRAQREADGL